MKPSTAVYAVLLALAVLAIGVGGFYRWIYQRHMADARIELANAKEEADSLRLEAASADSTTRLWEHRARILTDDLEERVAEFGILESRMRAADREAQVLANMYAELRDSRVLESTAELRGDSTYIGFAYADSVFQVKGLTSFPGRITPDPQPPTLTALEVRTLVRALLSVSCDEAGDPHAEAQTLDSRITIRELSVAVAQRVSCHPPPPGFMDLIPRPTVGTTVVGVISFGLGFVLGGR